MKGPLNCILSNCLLGAWSIMQPQNAAHFLFCAGPACPRPPLLQASFMSDLCTNINAQT